MNEIAALVAATLAAGTPLLLAAIGIVISERSGVVNLGIEGIMLVAAVAGFGAAHATGLPELGFGAGALAGAALALLFATLALGLLTNQYATGLALALFGAGLSAFLGQPLQGESLPARGPEGIPLLRDLPMVGPALFAQHWLVYFALLLVVAVAWFLHRTRAGLVLRAVGESPEAAHALGHPVRRIRFAALAFGGACAGLAGAYLSIVYTPLWSEGMVAGRGWIALALVTFATWRPGPRAARRVSVRRRDDAAVLPAGYRCGDSEPAAGDVAVSRHDRRARADLAQSALDPPEHAGFIGQGVQSQRVVAAFCQRRSSASAAHPR